jgi:hypothetical protein
VRVALAMAACLAAGLAVLWRPPVWRVVVLPAGTVELAAPLELAPGTELRGAPSGTVLRAAAGFRGRALVVCKPGADFRLRDFEIDGNRAALETRAGLPPSNLPFARFTPNNGVFAEDVTGLGIENLRLRHIAGFAVLVTRARHVEIRGLTVSDSGSRNAAGRNNTTGGILLEEGTTDFRVSGCVFERIRGNGVWTHSLYTSPRSFYGVIERNRFHTIGRDAVQVGHALAVRVVDNQGARIGYPAEDVDVEGLGYPAAIDTAGNVAHCLYARNTFVDLSGKCIDLDGFHDGTVRDNLCVNAAAPEFDAGNYGIVMNNNDPDMRPRYTRIVDNEVRGFLYGGLFVLGTGNTVTGNRLLEMNRARVADHLMGSGIFLAYTSKRPDPARGNLIENNVVTGHGMSRNCITAAAGASLADNTIRGNRCEDR